MVGRIGWRLRSRIAALGTARAGPELFCDARNSGGPGAGDFRTVSMGAPPMYSSMFLIVFSFFQLSANWLIRAVWIGVLTAVVASVSPKRTERWSQSSASGIVSGRHERDG